MAHPFPPWHGEDGPADCNLLWPRHSPLTFRHAVTKSISSYFVVLDFEARSCNREHAHVALSRNETHQNFNIWVYGERGKLVRGSGLFVGETGISADHHFLTPDDGNVFRFTQGHYRLDVLAHLLGDPKPIRLSSQVLDISRDTATALLEEKTAGLYFDWGPNAQRYLPHVEKRPPSPNAEEFLRLLGESVPTK